jgi:hypothetical protein
VFSDLVWREKDRESSWVECTWNWGLYVPELMIQLPSSLTRTQLLAVHPRLLVGDCAKGVHLTGRVAWTCPPQTRIPAGAQSC